MAFLEDQLFSSLFGEAGAVARLAANGRLPEAEALAATLSPRLAPHEQAAAYYHVLAAYALACRHTEARRAFRLLVRTRGSKFYGWHGAARLRLADGRIREATKLASQAEVSNDYERFLADELAGQLAGLSGDAERAATHLERAAAWIRAAGRVVTADQLSGLVPLFRARHGLARALPILPADAHPLQRAAFALETARLAALAEDLQTARGCLRDAARLATVGASTRFELTITIRTIDLALAEGDAATARVLARRLSATLDVRRDRIPLFELVAREEAAARALGMQDASVVLQSRLVQMAHRTGYVPPRFPSGDKLAEAKVTPRPPRRSESASLNVRQVELVEALVAGEVLDVHAYRARFDVSEITACRDLARLVALGHLERLGKARATRYRSVSTTGPSSSLPGSSESAGKSDKWASSAISFSSEIQPSSTKTDSSR